MFGTKHSKTNWLQKDHQIPNKGTDYKIVELKHGNAKLLGNTKNNQLNNFFLRICANIASNYMKKTWYNQ